MIAQRIARTVIVPSNGQALIASTSANAQAGTAAQSICVEVAIPIRTDRDGTHSILRICRKVLSTSPGGCIFGKRPVGTTGRCEQGGVQGQAAAAMDGSLRFQGSSSAMREAGWSGR